MCAGECFCAKTDIEPWHFHLCSYLQPTKLLNRHSCWAISRASRHPTPSVTPSATVYSQQAGSIHTRRALRVQRVHGGPGSARPCGSWSRYREPMQRACRAGRGAQAGLGPRAAGDGPWAEAAPGPACRLSPGPARDRLPALARQSGHGWLGSTPGPRLTAESPGGNGVSVSARGAAARDRSQTSLGRTVLFILTSFVVYVPVFRGSISNEVCSQFEPYLTSWWEEQYFCFSTICAISLSIITHCSQMLSNTGSWGPARASSLGSRRAAGGSIWWNSSLNIESGHSCNTDTAFKSKAL